jgi:hypothetical protein
MTGMETNMQQPVDTCDVSLFDVENLEEMPKVRDMTVATASTSDVSEFTRRYHYTRHSGADSWRWGLWHGVTLMGVVSYNNGSNTSTANVFGDEHRSHVWHMGRLALADHAPRNSESRLIAGSLRLIRSEYPDVWAVLTYADTDAGHLGYVYQATNAIYTGTGGDPRVYTDATGKRLTHRPGHGTITRADAARRDWVQHLAPPKHRYLYVLGNKTERRNRMAQLQLPTLPYPKAIQDGTGAA